MLKRFRHRRAAMSHLAFKYPWFLLLFVPYAALLYFYWRRVGKGEFPLSVSSDRVTGRRESFRTRTYGKLIILRFLSLGLLIFAMAGPGRGITYTSIKNQGIDIMIALDLSSSMTGEDFQPDNRLAVAKKVVGSFIARRVNDRIGLVVFAGDAYFQCPLVLEHEIISDIVADLEYKSGEQDGTAIGDALALAASRMAESRARSRIILLITDGMNNRGEIDPETAAKACASADIKVYTVGIGKEGRVPYPGPFGDIGPRRYLNNQFDGTTLQKIADITGGKYYRAESSGVFWDRMNDIDNLEKSEVAANTYYEFESRNTLPLAAGVALFLLEIILRSAVYRKIP